MKIKDLVEKYGEVDLNKDILNQLGINIKNKIPKEEEWYFYIDTKGDVICTKYFDNELDKHNVSVGNYYHVNYYTPDEANAIAAKKTNYNKAVWELKQEIERLNDGWVPNWKNPYEKKWCVYNDACAITYNFWYTYKLMPSWMYLKSEKLCEKLIETHKEQLNIYFEMEGN